MKRLLLAISVLIFCGFSSAFESQLGTIEFPNSGSEAAQENFTRAVLLLHSFEYEDAREAFAARDFRVAICGHTHVALSFHCDEEDGLVGIGNLLVHVENDAPANIQLDGGSYEGLVYNDESRFTLAGKNRRKACLGSMSPY